MKIQSTQINTMKSAIAYIIFLIVLVAYVPTIYAQESITSDVKLVNIGDFKVQTILGKSKNNPKKIKSKIHKNGKRLSNVCTSSTFEVTYTGFTPQAEAAFQYAVDIWESTLHSTVPIKINATWEPLQWDNEGKVLGQASPATLASGGVLAPISATLYPIALMNRIQEVDLAPAVADINASFNSVAPIWYFGTDANPGINQADFVSTVLHEIAHGLGFTGGVNEDGTKIFSNGEPLVWSRFIEELDGTPITDYPNDSPGLSAALRSNDLYFNGLFTVDNNNQNRAKIYAPTVFDAGSSYAHLDPIASSPLMEPSISTGEAKHVISDLELAMLYDMGWAVDVGLPIMISACTDDNSPYNLQDYLLCEDLCGEWSVNSNGINPSMGFDNAGIFTPNGNAAGTYMFDYEHLENGLVSTVTVELLDLDAGTAGPAVQVCQTSSAVISLAGEIIGEMSGGTWSVNPGGQQPSAGFDGNAGTFIPGNNTFGQYLFDYKIEGSNILGSPPLTCTANATSTQGNFSDTNALFGRTIDKPANCAPDPRTSNCNNFTLAIDVTAYNGAVNNMVISVRSFDCATSYFATLKSGIGTYSFDNKYFSDSVDPNEGFCVILFENGGNQTVTDIQFTTVLSIDYPEILASGCADKITTVAVDIIDCPPVANCQATAIAEIDAAGNLVLDPASLNNGSTDDNTLPGDLMFSIDFGGIVLDCADVDMPAQTVSLNVTDNSAQTSTCTVQVTVEDNIAPMVTCQNVVANLDANGSFNFPSAYAFSLVLTSFTDNCAPSPNNVGATQFLFSCNDLGINNEIYFYRDRPFSGTSREDNCAIKVQINDPLGVCSPGTLVANCMDFDAILDQNDNYTLDANSMDNGSNADLGLYTLTFSDDTDLQGELTNDCSFSNTGQGMAFTAGITGSIQTIRVDAVSANTTTLHIYEGDNGSGISGSVGTPAYSQQVEIFANPGGSLTNILLDTPYPVVASQRYSFVLEGTNTLRYACPGSPSYIGGRAIENYIGWFAFDEQSYAFEVDIIGPTTQDFTAEGTYPIDLYAVDNQGNVSPVCNANFLLESSCVADRQEDENPIISDLYEASNTISSSGVVSAGAVDFSAKTSIELQVGFEVVDGNEFHAYIQGCDN